MLPKVSRVSLVAGSLVLAACFPSLSEYAECSDGACGGSASTQAGSAPSGSGTQSTAASQPTSSSTGSDGGGGQGSTATGEPSSSSATGEPTSSTSDSTSSTGGGGAAPDPCAPPSDDATVQAGVLVAGTNANGDDYAFCTDAGEVTLRQYRRFFTQAEGDGVNLATVYGQVDACDWKAPSFAALEPTLGSISPTEWENPGAHADRPIVDVDFCDAVAYCSWAGKRLCGGIGGTTLTFDSGRDENEWWLACSHDSRRIYTYNDDDQYDGVSLDACRFGDPEEDCPAYLPDTCNSHDCSALSDLWTADEAHTAGCEGFDARLVNMSGNVMEWVDSCTDGDGVSGHECEQRGGSCPLGFYTSCAQVGTPAGNDAAARDLYIGFRCCWDPPER